MSYDYKLSMVERYKITSDFINRLKIKPDSFVESWDGAHTIEDTELNITYWLSNGFWFWGCWQPIHVWLGCINGVRAHRAVSKWKKQQEKKEKRKNEKKNKRMLDKVFNNGATTNR